MKFKVRQYFICLVALLHVIVFALYMSIYSEPRTNNPDGRGEIFPGVSQNVMLPSHLNHRDISGALQTAKIKRHLKPEVMKSECPDIKFPGSLGLQEGWYPVDQLRSAFVFSAYCDERENGSISIIGARTGKGVQFICQMWRISGNGREVIMTESKAQVSSLPEGHGRRYDSSVFKCPFERNVPDMVSMVSKSCTTPLNLLTVKNIKPEATRRKFTVCVTPFNFRYGRAYELVEWIELNRILGADRFTFYNFSTAENVNRVLAHYSSKGLVEVVNWNLPMGVDTWPKTNQPVEIHYFGQIAFLNECWRRNRKHSEFIVNIDLDEFIIPKQHDTRTWRELIATLQEAPAYLFQNVFFRKEFDDSKLNFSGMDMALKYKMVTLLKTVREVHVHPFSMRSKYIIRSDSALVLGIHNIPRMQEQMYPKRVPASTALLHHYRNWENPEDTKARTTDETIIMKYKDDILKGVQDFWTNFPDIELDIPIT